MSTCYNFVVDFVPVDVLAPVGAWASTATVIIKLYRIGFWKVSCHAIQPRVHPKCHDHPW